MLPGPESLALVDLALCKQHRAAAAICITPKGLRRLADELERGSITDSLTLPQIPAVQEQHQPPPASLPLRSPKPNMICDKKEEAPRNSEDTTMRQSKRTEADVVHDINSPTANVLAEVAAERLRQQTSEGWTPEHDDTHDAGQMAGAAACYSLTAIEHSGPNATIDFHWPWSRSWWKPKDKRNNLVRAAALLVAEIERLDRAKAHPPKPSTEPRKLT